MTKQFNEDLPENSHILQWDINKVNALWQFIESSETQKEEYFTKYYGVHITNFLKYIVNLEGRILDYGCGLGYLTEILLAQKIPCEACDFSRTTVNLVNQKFENNSLWKGAKVIENSVLPYEDNSIDLIICVETIEHILDEFLIDTLKEFYRILKPTTGRLFITTPNDENLGKSTVFCPECHSIFHRYQHLRKFNVSTLNTLITAQGFKTELCNATNLDFFKLPPTPSILTFNLRYLVSLIIHYLEIFNLSKSFLGMYLFRKRLSNKTRHLFWFGGK